MRVVVAGSSGLIGRALLAALDHDGHEIVRLVRREPGPGESRWDPGRDLLDAQALTGCEAAVNLAGVGIGDRRWSRARKQVILDSRVAATRLLSEAIASNGTPPVLVNASAVGIYGDRGDEVLTEESPPGRGFTAEVCTAWEDATSRARTAGVRVVHLRSATVLAAHGGALARQLPLFRLGLGGRLGSGHQWMSWITLRDEISVILHVLRDESLEGAVNAASPNPVTNGLFTRALGRALHRPAVLPVPRVGLRLVLGGELADELALVSQRTVPTRLVERGFAFADPDVDSALERVLAAG